MQEEQKEVLIQLGKAVGDTTSLTIVVAALVELLPAAAALISIIWGCIRIYETKTVQKWLDRKRH